MSDQSSKKSKSLEFLKNSSRSDAESVSSPQTFRSPRSSRLNTSPPSIAFRGRSMSERCSCCHQFHSRTYNVPQGVCFHCGQPGHFKKNCLKLTGTTSMGQSSRQPRALVQDFNRTAKRSSGSARSAAGSSFGTQGVANPKNTNSNFCNDNG